MSIRAKLALLAALPVLLGVVAVGVALAVVSARAGTADLEERTARYAALASEQVQSAIAFDDRETAREIFEAVARDHAVRSIALYRADGSLLFGHGAAISHPQAVTARPVHHAGDLAMTVPVVSLEGPRGTLSIVVSTAELDAARRRTLEVTAIAALLAVALALMIGLPVARRLSRRVVAIVTVAGRIADGDLEVAPLASGARDELGQTAIAVDTMVARLRASIAREAERAASEKARLEHMVDQRTAQLTARDQDVRRILANVNQGLLTVTRSGVVVGERSDAVDVLVPSVRAGAALADAVRAAAPAVAGALALGFDQLVDDFLPLEVALDQLPHEVTLDQRDLTLAYAPIDHDGDPCERVLVTITDVTAARQRDRARAADDERVALFRAISADRRGLERFLADATLQIAVAAAPGPAGPVKAALHTLKGNSAALELAGWPARCHAAEDELADTGALSTATRAALASAWRDTAARAQPWLGDRDRLCVTPADLAHLIKLVDRAANARELRAGLADLALEPTRQSLTRLADHARQVAVRRGQAAIEVAVDDHGVRLDPARWAPLWSVLVHVARNCVTHGLATTGHRLSLTSRATDDDVTIEIADDGAGIDWTAVAARATALGLPAGDHPALVAALFADGLSTHATVDQDAGRGVGLAAVAAVCRQLGVAIAVDSAPGRGTTFTFTLPARRERLGPTDHPLRPRSPSCELAS